MWHAELYKVKGKAFFIASFLFSKVAKFYKNSFLAVSKSPFLSTAAKENVDKVVLRPTLESIYLYLP